MIIKPVLRAVLSAFKESEFFDQLMELLEGVFQRSNTLGKAVSGINAGVDVYNEKLDSLGVKGMLLKQLVRSFIGDLAEDNEKISMGLKLGLPYVKAVYDGLDVDEVFAALKPVLTRVAEGAAEKVNGAVAEGEFIRMEDGEIIKPQGLFGNSGL